MHNKAFHRRYLAPDAKADSLVVTLGSDTRVLVPRDSMPGQSFFSEVGRRFVYSLECGGNHLAGTIHLSRSEAAPPFPGSNRNDYGTS
jgi:hypothetical protein